MPTSLIKVDEPGKGHHDFAVGAHVFVPQRGTALLRGRNPDET